MRPWTREEDEQLANLARLRMPGREIARAIKRTECAVKQRLFHLRKIGALPPSGRKAPPRKNEPARKRQPRQPGGARPPRSRPVSRWEGPDGERFRRLWETGWSIPGIAEQFGISHGSVLYAARCLGLKRRRRAGRTLPMPGGKVPPAPTGLIADAKTFLRRRGNVVYDATVVGGPKGKVVFNGRMVTEEELIAAATRVGFTVPESAAAA